VTQSPQRGEEPRSLRPAGGEVIGRRGRAILLSAAILASSLAAAPVSAQAPTPQSLTPAEVEAAVRAAGIPPAQKSAQNSVSSDTAKIAVAITLSTAVGLSPAAQNSPGPHWLSPPTNGFGFSPTGAVIWIVGTTIASSYAGPLIAQGLGDGWLARALVNAGASGLAASPIPGAALPAAAGGFVSSLVDSAVDQTGVCSADWKPWLKSAGAGTVAACTAGLAGAAAPGVIAVGGVVAAGTLATNKAHDAIDKWLNGPDPWSKQDAPPQTAFPPIGNSMLPGDAVGPDGPRVPPLDFTKDLALTGPGLTSRDPSVPSRNGPGGRTSGGSGAGGGGTGAPPWLQPQGGTTTPSQPSGPVRQPQGGTMPPSQQAALPPGRQPQGAQTPPAQQGQTPGGSQQPVPAAQPPGNSAAPSSAGSCIAPSADFKPSPPGQTAFACEGKRGTATSCTGGAGLSTGALGAIEEFCGIVTGCRCSIEGKEVNVASVLACGKTLAKTDKPEKCWNTPAARTPPLQASIIPIGALPSAPPTMQLEGNCVRNLHSGQLVCPPGTPAPPAVAAIPPAIGHKIPVPPSTGHSMPMPPHSGATPARSGTPQAHNAVPPPYIYTPPPSVVVIPTRIKRRPPPHWATPRIGHRKPHVNIVSVRPHGVPRVNIAPPRVHRAPPHVHRAPAVQRKRH